METWQNKLRRRKLIGPDRKEQMLTLVQGSLDAAEEARDAARAAAEVWQAEPAIRLPRRTPRKKAAARRRRQVGAAVAALVAISTAAGGATALIGGGAESPPSAALTAPASLPDATLRDLLAGAVEPQTRTLVDLGAIETPGDEAAAELLPFRRPAATPSARTSGQALAVSVDSYNRPGYRYETGVDLLPIAFEGDLAVRRTAALARTETTDSDTDTETAAAAPTTTTSVASSPSVGRGKAKGKSK